MFTITKKAPNRVDIAISETIDSDGMTKILDEFLEKSKDVQNGQMLYTITDFSMPTMGALWVELTRLPKLFGLIGKFKKCAVLTDVGWIRKAASVEGALIPGLTIKTFELDQVAAAEAWLKSA
jgi:hypothetical protein